MLSVKFKNLIKTGELVKAPVPLDDSFLNHTYWLYTRNASKGHRKRDLKKTIALAEELQAWAYHEEGTSHVCAGELGWNWIRSEEKYNKWEKLEYVPVGIASPASRILDELIEKEMIEDTVMGRSVVTRSSIHLTMEIPDSLKKDTTNGLLPDERMVGYFRADHDGYRWHYTWFDGKNREANAGEVKKELEFVGTQLIFHGFLNGVYSLREFVNEALKECVCGGNVPSILSQDDEYNFYYSGDCCDYWVRFILRNGDYNMYIKCYQKELFFHEKPEVIKGYILANKISCVASKHAILYEIHSEVEENCVIVYATVSGDWKHTHKYLDYLVEEQFSPDKIEETPISTTDSDYYTSEHRYYFSV